MSVNIKSEEEKIIDIDQILNFIWHSKITILTSIFLVSVMSVIYALSVPNIYTSKALLVPSQNESGVNSSLRAYSGLANFAGVNLPSSDSMNTLEAIEKLKPRGQAIEVPYSNDKSVNSMRTAVYQFCRQKEYTVKSRRDSTNKKIYFYRDK
mgnify:CR=1 FL=1